MICSSIWCIVGSVLGLHNIRTVLSWASCCIFWVMAMTPPQEKATWAWLFVLCTDTSSSASAFITMAACRHSCGRVKKCFLNLKTPVNLCTSTTRDWWDTWTRGSWTWTRKVQYLDTRFLDTRLSSAVKASSQTVRQAVKQSGKQSNSQASSQTVRPSVRYKRSINVGEILEHAVLGLGQARYLDMRFSSANQQAVRQAV